MDVREHAITDDGVESIDGVEPVDGSKFTGRGSAEIIGHGQARGAERARADREQRVNESKVLRQVRLQSDPSPPLRCTSHATACPHDPSPCTVAAAPAELARNL